jgi:hypothetical protein
MAAVAQLCCLAKEAIELCLLDEHSLLMSVAAAAFPHLLRVLWEQHKVWRFRSVI